MGDWSGPVAAAVMNGQLTVAYPGQNTVNVLTSTDGQTWSSGSGFAGIATWMASGLAMCQVVYADNDPIVLTHARALLSGSADTTSYVHADIRDTGEILRQAARTLDLSRPVAIVLFGILQLIPDDDDPYAIVGRLTEAVCPGSYLVISQIGRAHV